MYIDKDQFYVCDVGSSALPYLETDKTPLIVFSFTWLQRSTEFQQKWKSWKCYAKISTSVVIMSHFFRLISTPSHTETTNYSPLNRWAPIHNQARTISRPWLDSFPLNVLLPAAAVGAWVTMETVVIVAIGVLATIFLASFVALVVVCRHRYCHPHDLLHHFDSKSVDQYKT